MHVHVVDLNGDGAQDVMFAPSDTCCGRLSWYQAVDPKNGPWIENVIDGSVDHIHTFKTADMDLDGILDVVTAEMPFSARRRRR